MRKSLLKLQNGSDIRGVALPGVKDEPVNLSPENVSLIGRAFVDWLEHKTGIQKNDLKISIGRDSRISGEKLSDALAQGMTGEGCQVADFGLCSTPAMFMSTITPGYEFHGAVMLTASHLPFNRNGLKFFTADGGLNKADIRLILEKAGQLHPSALGNESAVKSMDFLSVYARQLVQKIREKVHATSYDHPLSGLKIIVDAGNGSGGFFAEKVLKQLGADTTGSQFLIPDGRFPNHIPNPEDSDAIQSLQEAVLKHHADMGIIFDTDVDRAAIVDHNGNAINRNELIALLAAIVLDDHPGSTIVTDSVTSEGLTGFIEGHLKGKHLRYKRGYKNVIDKGIDLNKTGTDCWLAMETSGHGALRENYFLDDGAYLVAKVLMKLGEQWHYGKKHVSELIAELKKPVDSKEFRFKIQEQDFKQPGEAVIQALHKMARAHPSWKIPDQNFEGIRVRCPDASQDGWFLLRLSLHDPVLPLNVESNVKNGVQSIILELYQFLKDFSNLDLQPIVIYLENVNKE